MIILQTIKSTVNSNLLDYNLAEGSVQCFLSGRIPLGDFIRFIFSLLSKSIKPAIATFFSFFFFPGFLSVAGIRRSFSSQSLKPVADYPLLVTMVLNKINKCALRSIYQPFFKSSGFVKLYFIICNFSLSNVCFIDLSKVGQFRCIWCLV